MTIKLGGTNKACAACKFQRRRCSKGCILSPYFPAEEADKFNNVHRLFGVRNIKTILNQASPEQRDEAMKSIIYESDIQAKYPIEGCLGVMRRYDILLRDATEELYLLRMLKLNLTSGYIDYECPSPNSVIPMDQLSQFINLPNSSVSRNEVNIFYNHLAASLSVSGGKGVGDSIDGSSSSTDGSSSSSIESETVDSDVIDVKPSYLAGGVVFKQEDEDEDELDVTADNDDILDDSNSDDKDYISGWREEALEELRIESLVKSTKTSRYNELGSKDDAILDHKQYSFVRCKEEFDFESSCKSSSKRYIERGPRECRIYV
ncbi:LOB domain-containing protein 27-like [Senna tora]|uniref:LOB domain-containing protein 27-like n=1 Tax=Senna tora TaxID=362788 RepID=A0A834WHK9_9FABA|nr:LOB domain-containing protein 27-like [Senna tora]